MPGFSVKIKSKKGQFIVKDLTESTTIGDLKSEIYRLTSIESVHLHALIGFPPRPLDLSANSDVIGTVGIKSGETLIVEEKMTGGGGGGIVAGGSAQQPSIQDDEALARRLQAEEQEALTRSSLGRFTPPFAGTYEHAGLVARLPLGQYNGVLQKKVVAADNSCLFSSIRFVLKGRLDNSEGSELMRHIIAQTVSADPLQFNDAVLGKSNAEYCVWIQKQDTWGGAIEVAILADYYGIEIDVVDVQNAIINRFGEDKNYKLRVFLLFDGIHYDPLYMSKANINGPITLFPVEELSVYHQAEQLATKAKADRQFTDVVHFELRCMVCNKELTGQDQAQDHAKLTGHKAFDEI